jgi:hypothetical protein
MDGASPTRPAGVRVSPRWITPFRKVPVVSTTRGARYDTPGPSMTPATTAVLDDQVLGGRGDDVEVGGGGQLSLHGLAIELAIDLGARAAHGGPLERFSIRNWMPALSAIRPMTPSRASISRTRWPLPRPPMAGLQDISPMVSSLWVSSRVRAPVRAAAAGRLAAGVAAADDNNIPGIGQGTRLNANAPGSGGGAGVPYTRFRRTGRCDSVTFHVKHSGQSCDQPVNNLSMFHVEPTCRCRNWRRRGPAHPRHRSGP